MGRLPFEGLPEFSKLVELFGTPFSPSFKRTFCELLKLGSGFGAFLFVLTVKFLLPSKFKLSVLLVLNESLVLNLASLAPSKHRSEESFRSSSAT